MKFHHVNPILYSADVLKSLDYYTQVLGFENRWDWGSPPTFGGVSRDGVEIFFCENGQGNPGTWLSVFVDNVDALYEKIKAKGAKIIHPPQTMEWGVKEMLVEDPDGHRIRFGHGVHVFDHAKSLNVLPDTVRIISRPPSIQEYRRLALAVHWKPSGDDVVIEKIIAAAVFAVVAVNSVSGDAIGTTLLLGDNTSFFYVKDVMVDPEWQHKRIGSALMHSVMTWLHENSAENALVGLYTGDSLAGFYGKFGFKPAFGMSQRIRKPENE